MKNEIIAKYDMADFIEKGIKIPDKPKTGLILIVGSSGSGKTTILNNWFDNCLELPTFKEKHILDDFSSVEDGERLLLSCGLRSIPTWFRAFTTLSNGEAHRAYCAKSLDMGVDYIDEFTSVVDRNVAKSLSVSIKKYHKKTGGLLVISTCHRDVEDWLQPDTVYDTDCCSYRARGSLQQPKLEMEIHPCTVEDWVYFKNHHYLSDSISKSCHCYIGIINNEPVAFSAIIHGCGRDIRTYWRESRLVVKPSFQGMGAGVKMSEAVAQIYIDLGKRFFSKTAHPAMGAYRNNSAKWRGTSTNGQRRRSYLKKDGSPRIQKGFGKSAEQLERDSSRICFSHEYIAEAIPVDKAQIRSKQIQFTLPLI